MQDLRVDGRRLWARLTELGRVGGLAGGGCCRLALSDDDRTGRDLVVAWMGDLGMTVEVDAVGNVIATRPGRACDAAPVMCGSHIDTVRTGGLYDGNLGVLAGLEVVETIAAAGVTTERPLAVAFFTDEEGSRFAPDMLGSLVYAGGMTVEQAHDVVGIDGARLGDELARIGYLGARPCPGRVPHAYVELHIEQGPVLEDEGRTIGVVTGVQGISWLEVAVEGRSGHAGTTPMHLRRDAGLAAMRIGTGVRELVADHGPPLVATVGRVELEPDLVNVIAGRATLTVDLRHGDEPALQRAEKDLANLLDEVATAEGCSVTTRPLARFEPVDFDPDVVALVERTAEELGLSSMRLPSGAGHDAQMLARVCPAGMVFVPSVDGLSHNVAEYSRPADVEAGANVLLHALLALAGVVGDGGAGASP